MMHIHTIFCTDGNIDCWRLFMTNVEELTHMGFIHD